MWILKFIIVLVLLVSASVSYAADTLFYIRDGATGTYATTQCDSWAADRACDQLPTTLSRGTTGATYYIADGAYEGYYFNATSAPVDGTKVLTIKKATTGDHGTETGWDATYGDGQATFKWSDRSERWKCDTFRIVSSYITIDGAKGTGDDIDSYGFRFYVGDTFGELPSLYFTLWVGIHIGSGSSSDRNKQISNIVVRYTASYGPSNDEWYACFDGTDGWTCSNNGIASYFTVSAGGGGSNILIENNLLAHWNNNFSFRAIDGLIIQNNYLSSNIAGVSVGGIHGQNGNLDTVNDVDIRRNIFYRSRTFAIALHQLSQGTIDNLRVYNNIFDSQTPGAFDTIIGTMTADEDTLGTGVDVYGNTIVNMSCGANGILGPGTLTNLDNISHVYNNLIYNSTNCGLRNPGRTPGIIHHDYNAYISTTGYTTPVAWATSTSYTTDMLVTQGGNYYRCAVAHTSGTFATDLANGRWVTTENGIHNQIDTDGISPFTDIDNKDFTINITADAANDAHVINTGYTLSSPYDTDYILNSRPSGIAFDIGAYESSGEPASDTTAPTLAEVTSVTTPSSNQSPVYIFSTNEACSIAYGGDCNNGTGTLSSASVGNNTTQWTLGVGAYTNCTITCTDASDNASAPLSVTPFTITSSSTTVNGGVIFSGSLP